MGGAAARGLFSWLACPPDGRARDYLDLGQREHVGVGVFSGQRLGLDDARHHEAGIREGPVPVPIGPVKVDLGAVRLFEHDRGPIEIAPLDKEPAFFGDWVERRHPREREHAAGTENPADFAKGSLDVLDEAERVGGERDVEARVVQYREILNVGLEEADGGLLRSREGAACSSCAAKKSIAVTWAPVFSRWTAD